MNEGENELPSGEDGESGSGTGERPSSNRKCGDLESRERIENMV